MTSRPSVLVTGGAKRIGAAISRRFSEAGWHVVIHCHSSRKEADELASNMPSAQVISCDLSDHGAAQNMIGELASELTDWRCLINNAAIFLPDEVTGLDVLTNRLSMQINTLSPTLMAQAYLANAQSKAGRRVIQITDQKLANLNPDFFSYSVSKAAVDVATRMMAMNTSEHGSGEDRVYCLAPGAILPSYNQSEEEADVSHRLNLLNRRTQAKEVADTALFFANGQIASGQVLYVDSGQHLLAQPHDVIHLARENAAFGSGTSKGEK